MGSVLFGLKLWSSNVNLIKSAYELIKSNYFQYVELSPIPETSITPFQEMSIPYVIHQTPDKYGVNIADSIHYDRNYQNVKECINWANKLNAKFIIIHPGYGELNNAVKFLENFDDPRFLIENMPKIGLHNEKMIGYNPEELQTLMGKEFGFCLDFSHAIKAAVSLKLDYKHWIINLLTLNPELFHISDGLLTNELDEHLNIGMGHYNWNFLMQCINKTKTPLVTLETPRGADLLNSDIDNLKRLGEVQKHTNV